MKAKLAVPLFLLFLLFPGFAYGDGFVIGSEENVPVFEPSQCALIKKEKGYETIILRIRVTTRLDQIGWLIPLPSYPEVSEGPKGIFTELEKLTPPPPPPHYGITYLSETIGEDSVAPYVKVETDTVGIYEVNKIQSNDGSALYDWLNENEFKQSASVKPILDEYIDNRFSFIAIRVLLDNMDTTQKLEAIRSKWLPPLRIRFKTKKLFYPMKISSLNPGSTRLTLWILDRYQVDFPGASFIWGKKVNSNRLRTQGFKSIAKEVKGTRYLTRLSREWQMNSNIKQDIYPQRLPGIFGLYEQASESQKNNIKGAILIGVLVASWNLPKYLLGLRYRRHMKTRKLFLKNP
jgi:hypothetical protein